MNIDRINNNKPEKPFHSSSYAEVANGGSIGSTNNQTFGQRYAVDQNRSVVRRYRDSHIGRGALRHQARKGITDPYVVRIDPVVPTSLPAQSATPIDPTTPGLTNNASRPVSSPAPRSSFKEPPTRGFNPYD